MMKKILACGLLAASMGAALAATGSGIVAPVFVRDSAGAVARTFKDKAADTLSARDFGVKCNGVADDYKGLQAAIDAAKDRHLSLPAGECRISKTLTISHATQIDGGNEGKTTIKKTADVVAIEILAPYVRLTNLWIKGRRLEATDTTDGIVIGRTDGNNGYGPGYIDAQRFALRNVIVENVGRDSVSWQEGAFGILDNVASLASGRHGYYVSDKSFDASHGSWYTTSAGAEGDGYNINWGVHTFITAKSFADKGRGLYLNKTRGSAGNIFVELSGGAAIELSTETLANNINIQFWTTGKDPIDNGIGNNLSGMELGGNNGAWVQWVARSKRLMVGSLLIEPQNKADYRIGDPVEMRRLQAAGGGVSLQAMAIGHSTFDAGGFPVINLGAGNQYIDTWYIAPGNRINLNGASHEYAPFDGQTITVFRLGSGAAISIEGYIDGSYSTRSLTLVNDSVTFIWKNAIGWLVKK